MLTSVSFDPGASHSESSSDSGEDWDPVAVARDLVLRGYDPVVAFLHVGFTLEQIAAAGYDVRPFLPPDPSSVEPSTEVGVEGPAGEAVSLASDWGVAIPKGSGPEPPLVDLGQAATAPAVALPAEWYAQRDDMLRARQHAQARWDRRQAEARARFSHGFERREEDDVPPPTDPPPEVELLLTDVVLSEEPSAAVAPYDAGSDLRVAGERKVIVHLLVGAVKRGTLRDADLNAPTIHMETQPGAVTAIPRDQIKAIFFLRSSRSGGTPPEGRRLRISLVDGRTLVGFTLDNENQLPGFFIVPVDAGSTERVFLLRAAIRSISPG